MNRLVLLSLVTYNLLVMLASENRKSSFGGHATEVEYESIESKDIRERTAK